MSFSSYYLEEGDNYIMSDYNQRMAKKHMALLKDQKQLKQLVRYALYWSIIRQ
jgi:hypothetical protein